MISPIIVEPCGDGWTVRHRTILFERFSEREAAVYRARRLMAELTLRRLSPGPIQVRDERGRWRRVATQH